MKVNMQITLARPKWINIGSVNCFHLAKRGDEVVWTNITKSSLLKGFRIESFKNPNVGAKKGSWDVKKFDCWDSQITF